MAKKILLIKTSSLGDVVHTLPAITDALSAYPDLQIDWVVEESFVAIAALHPGVAKIIPLAWRTWRKKLMDRTTWAAMKKFYKNLTQTKYDLIIDAQGLMKSGILTKLSRGMRCGLSFSAAREPLASLCYQKNFFIKKGQHAITRSRELFSKILNYSYTDYPLNYGLTITKNSAEPYIILLHGTTWVTKNWPEVYWQQLARLITQQGLKIRLLWGNQTEYERAVRIGKISPLIEVCSQINLTDAIKIIGDASAIVAVDTGLAQLAAALAVPAIVLYGPTQPALTGSIAHNHTHLSSTLTCAPCFKRHCKIAKPNSPLFPPCFTELTPNKIFNLLSKEFACKLVFSS